MRTVLLAVLLGVGTVWGADATDELTQALMAAPNAAARAKLLDANGPLENGGAKVVALLLNAGERAGQAGRFEDGLRLVAVALEVAERLGLPRQVAWCHLFRGLVLHSAAQWPEAITAYEEALRRFQAAKNRAGEAAAYGNLGNAYNRFSQWARAIECHQQCLAIAQELKDRRSEGLAYGGLGTAYQGLGQWARAIEYHQKLLAIALDLKDRAGEGAAYGNLGIAYNSLSQWARAIEYHQKHLAIAVELKDRAGEGRAYGNLGCAYDSLGQWARAIEYYQKLLAIALDANDRAGEGGAYGGLGATYHRLGRWARAIDCYQNALAVFHGLQNRNEEATVLHNLRLLSARQHQPRLAIYYGKLAVNLIQSLRADQGALDKSLQQSFLKSKEDAYRGLADLLIAEGRLLEAQRVLDLLKDAEFFEFVRRNTTALPAAGSVEYNREEAGYATRYRGEGDQLAALGVEYDQLVRLDERTPAQEARLAEVRRLLAAGRERFAAFMKALAADLGRERPQVVAEVRDGLAFRSTLGELGDGSVAIYTAVTPERLHLVLYTAQTQKAVTQTIAAAAVSARVEALRRALQNPHGDPRPAAQAVYDLMVKPLEADLAQAGAKTLYWSLDGVLRYVPTAALWDGRQYLVERYRQAVINSQVKDKLKDQPAANWRGLGLGCSTGDEQRHLRPLPAVRTELASIFGPGRPVNGQVLLDDAFTAEAFETALERKGQYQLLHIATHFACHADDRESFLLLGRGAALTLEELRAKPQVVLNMDLVALSACETALGGDGREVDGLGMWMQTLGAKAVLASLWSVEDDSTAALMSAFYQRRAQRPAEGKLEAFRQAQLALLHGELGQGGRWRHPYYWAPFVLIGNGR